MGLLKRFFSQTRKPEGALGKRLLGTMNSGHAQLADWGFTHLPELAVEQAVDLGCGGGRNAGELAFDSCNERGAKLMRKTWLKEAGITDVSAFFSLEDEAELSAWSDRFASVTAKSYMRGYRDVYQSVGLFHKLMIRFCDSLVKMKIIKIVFGG